VLLVLRCCWRFENAVILSEAKDLCISSHIHPKTTLGAGCPILASLGWDETLPVPQKSCHPWSPRQPSVGSENVVILSGAKDLCISSHVSPHKLLARHLAGQPLRTHTRLLAYMAELNPISFSLTETTTVTGSYRLPAPFRCSAPHSPPGWPVSQVQKDEYRIRFRKLKPMQSAVDCQRNWTEPAIGTLPSLAKLHKNIKGSPQSQLVNMRDGESIQVPTRLLTLALTIDLSQRCGGRPRSRFVRMFSETNHST